MATFLSRPGFKPVKHLSGAPYNGQANVYFAKASNAVAVGDAVYLDAASTAEGVQVVVNATAATGSDFVGVCVGVINAKLDPIFGKLSTGSINLDVGGALATGLTSANATGGSAYILVADDPDLIFEVQTAASYTAANVGNAFDVTGTAGGVAATGNSAQLLDTAGVTNKVFRILKASTRFMPAAGGATAQAIPGDTLALVEVYPFKHVYRGSTEV